MSAEAMAVVEQFTEGFTEGEMRWDLIDPEIDIVDHDIPDAGTYHGHAACQVAPGLGIGVGELGGRAGATRGRGRLRGGGLHDDRARQGEWRLDAAPERDREHGANGLVSRIEYYATEEEALAAAGLAARQED